jgi:NADPH:quinone reductase-like Zn-dependent oxidoreductase
MIAPIGTLIPDEPQYDGAAAAARDVRIVPTMSNHARAGAQLRKIVDLYNSATLRPPAITILPLTEAGEAQRRVKDGHVRGKILLHVADL